MWDDLQNILNGNQAIPVEVDADEAISKIKSLALPVGIGLFLIIIISILLANYISSKF